MDLPQADGQRPQLSYVLPAGWACGDQAPSLPELLDAGVLTLPSQALEQHCATAAWTGPQTRTRIETILCDTRITRLLRDSIGQITGLHALNDQITPTSPTANTAAKPPSTTSHYSAAATTSYGTAANSASPTYTCPG